MTELSRPAPRAPEELGFETIVYEKAPPRATIRLNRPEVLNAFDFRMLRELARACEDSSWDDEIRAVVVTGTGRAFCVGADLKSWGVDLVGNPREYWKWFGAFKDMHDRLREIGKPTLARINGIAVGGGNELQMACAYRIASRRAELGQPEINLHVIPGFGGTQMLPRLAARRARAGGGQMYSLLVDALAVLLDGRRRSAERMQALGVVDEVAPADALSQALDVARRIALGEFTGTLWSPLTETGTPPAFAGPNPALASFAVSEARVLLVGHSHVALAFTLADQRLETAIMPGGTEIDLSSAGGRWILNPGSVGQPRDGDPRAAYLLIEEERQRAEYRRVEYPIERTQEEIREHGLPEPLAELEELEQRGVHGPVVRPQQ